MAQGMTTPTSHCVHFRDAFFTVFSGFHSFCVSIRSAFRFVLRFVSLCVLFWLQLFICHLMSS